MYPDRDTFEQLYPFQPHNQSMVESGVTQGGKITASFHFLEWTQQESTTQAWILKLKSNEFQSYPRRETAASQ